MGELFNPDALSAAAADLRQAQINAATQAHLLAQSKYYRQEGCTTPTEYLVTKLGLSPTLARRMMADANILFRLASSDTRRNIMDGALGLDTARAIKAKVKDRKDFNALAQEVTGLDDKTARKRLNERKQEPTPPRQRCRFHHDGYALRVSAVLTGSDGAKIHAALIDQVRKEFRGKEEKRSTETRAADALVSLMSGAGGAGDGALAVIVPAEPHTVEQFRTTTGVTLSPEQANELVGEDVRPWVLFTHPVTLQPLALGRTSRLASVSQRMTLLLTQRTCAIEGCNVPMAKCQIHHKHEWKEGGLTDIDNLVGVCARHHALITQGYLKPP